MAFNFLENTTLSVAISKLNTPVKGFSTPGLAIGRSPLLTCLRWFTVGSVLLVGLLFADRWLLGAIGSPTVV